MRKITTNQMTIVSDFAKKTGVQMPEFNAGDSIMALHEWSLSMLCALTLTWAQTGDGDVALSMSELRNIILLEIM